MARLSMGLTAAAAAAAVVALTALPSAQGYAKYAALLPNGDMVPDAPAIGHPDAAGMNGLNEFGKDWNKLGKSWTKAYCQADSDGDGFTNGQELGDPCCTWTPTNTGSLITEGISHPSDKTKTPTNPTLQAKCATGGGTSGGSTSGGASNSTAGGGGATTTDDTLPGTVNAGPAVPEDDDEDDEDETETLKPKASGAVAPSVGAAAAAMCSVAVAVVML